MKSFTSIAISVFAKPEDDAKKLETGLIKLIPFDLENEKIAVDDQTAQGFNQRTIHIYTITLQKDRHVNAFVDFLLEKLSKQQRIQLVNEADTRLDSDLMFFLRIDKALWVNDGILQLTDSGSCYHIKCTVAAFPKKRDIALEVATNVFKPV